MPKRLWQWVRERIVDSHADGHGLFCYVFKFLQCTQAAAAHPAIQYFRRFLGQELVQTGTLLLRKFPQGLSCMVVIVCEKHEDGCTQLPDAAAAFGREIHKLWWPSTWKKANRPSMYHHEKYDM
ncbi:MAG TPA: hypothetical protein VFK06_19220 [Candidatus Angelobacter sp.]|nr:hypothetical protein [Candidatus Angelobacter sp.]